MRLATLVRLAALGLVAALLAVLVYRLVRGPGSGIAQAAKAHREPRVPATGFRVLWTGAGAWPSGLTRPTVGTSLRLDQLRGYRLVVNFWASWCEPCKREAPLLAAAATRQRAHVAFIGVDVQDLASDARRFLRRHHVPYMVVRGGDSAVSRFGVVGLPETFYVDRTGRIQDVTEGPVTPSILEHELGAGSS